MKNIFNLIINFIVQKCFFFFVTLKRNINVPNNMQKELYSIGIVNSGINRINCGVFEDESFRNWSYWYNWSHWFQNSRYLFNCMQLAVDEEFKFYNFWFLYFTFDYLIEYKKQIISSSNVSRYQNLIYHISVKITVLWRERTVSYF